MTIKLYTHPQCLLCKDIKKMLEQSGGKVDGENIEIVDISTDEGFEEFNREVLSKGDGIVPSAYRGSQQCKILHEHNSDKLKLSCPNPQKPTDFPPE